MVYALYCGRKYESRDRIEKCRLMDKIVYSVSYFVQVRKKCSRIIKKESDVIRLALSPKCYNDDDDDDG